VNFGDHLSYLKTTAVHTIADILSRQRLRSSSDDLLVPAVRLR